MRRSSGQLSTGPRCRRRVVILAFPLLFLASFTPVSLAQAADGATAAEQQRVAAIETKLNELNDALSQTEKMLEKSRAEIQALHAQLDALRSQNAAASATVPPPELPENTNPGPPGRHAG
jgi:uncharacterized coiled-coil protein SlyX